MLLADGNIGIGGDTVATLRRAAEMHAPGGGVIVEIDPPTTALSREVLRWKRKITLGAGFRGHVSAPRRSVPLRSTPGSR